MTNQNRLFFIQIYITQSETSVGPVKSEVEEPLLVTNQTSEAIDQSEAGVFHVENDTKEISMEIDQSEEVKNDGVSGSDLGKNEPSEKENSLVSQSESKEKQNLPIGMDFATAIMEDDIEAFEAIRNLFSSANTICDINYIIYTYNLYT